MRYVVRFLRLCGLALIAFIACIDIGGDSDGQGCGYPQDNCIGVVCDDDGNECTRDCNPATGACDYTPVYDGTACDFDGLAGVCIEGMCGEDPCEGVVCDDSNACTDDECNYVDGTCYFPPVVCDDNNPCTKDACDPATGCTFTPAEDGTWCIEGGGELWLMGVCEARACVGPCEPWVSGQTYPYPCPIEGYEHLDCCSGRDYCQPFCGY